MSFKDWLKQPLYEQEEHPDIVARRREEEHLHAIAMEEKARTNALAAAPAWLAELREAQASHAASFSFEVTRAAEFLVLRWTVDGQGYARGLNLTAVTDIVFTPGEAVKDTGGRIEFDPRDGSYRFVGYAFLNATYLSSWRPTLYDPLFPVPGMDATITFVGVDFKLGVPHSHGEATYAAILDAITKGATK